VGWTIGPGTVSKSHSLEAEESRSVYQFVASILPLDLCSTAVEIFSGQNTTFNCLSKPLRSFVMRDQRGC
jgi:hypothetical protein